MSEFQAAFDEWRRDETRNQARARLFAKLADIGSVEQAANEAQARLDQIRAEQDKATRAAAAQVEEVRQQATAVARTAEAHLADARAQAAKLLDDARKEAADLIAAAKSDAARIAAKVETDLRKQREALAAAAVEQEQWTAKVAALKADHAEVSKAVDVAAAEHARVMAAHEAFKKSVGL